MRINEKARSGFTLIELMISISIIGLIAILSVPNFSRFMQSWKLQGDSSRFASMLRTARAAAIAKNINVVFAFDTEDGTYYYFEDNDRDGSHDSNEYHSAIHSLESGITFAGRTLSSGTLTFGAMGNTRESGSVTLRNSYNRTRMVRLFGGSGNITIE